MNPYYQPQSIAPILERASAQQIPMASQPTGGIVGALPALGGLANTGFEVAANNQKKQSVLAAQQAYSDYLAKVDSGTANEQDHAAGRMAAFSLGIQPPDTLGMNLKKAQLNDLTVDPSLMAKRQKELGMPGVIPNTKENFTAASALSKDLVENKDKRDAAASAKNKEKTDKGLILLGAALDPSKMRSGAFGVSKQVFDRAERLESLANAYKDGNLDSRQMEELGIGLNAMLSGSNSGASEQVKSLVPKTFMGNMMGIKEFLSNNPKGTNQQEFVKRMMGTIQREKSVAGSQIMRTQMQRIAPFQYLEKADPEGFARVLQSNDVDPKNYKDWAKGGYKPMSAVQSPEGGSGPKPGDVQAGEGGIKYKFKGGDQYDQNNWVKVQ